MGYQIARVPGYALEAQFVDGLHILLRLDGVDLVPPFEQERIGDQLEPWSHRDVLVRKHGPKLIGCHVFDVPDLVRIHVERNVRLDEEDVVD